MSTLDKCLSTSGAEICCGDSAKGSGVLISLGWEISNFYLNMGNKTKLLKHCDIKKVEKEQS